MESGSPANTHPHPHKHGPTKNVHSKGDESGHRPEPEPETEKERKIYLGDRKYVRKIGKASSGDTVYKDFEDEKSAQDEVDKHKRAASSLRGWLMYNPRVNIVMPRKKGKTLEYPMVKKIGKRKKTVHPVIRRGTEEKLSSGEHHEELEEEKVGELIKSSTVQRGYCDSMHKLASIMGSSMAALHYKARLDGKGIVFLLGNNPEDSEEDSNSEEEEEREGGTDEGGDQCPSWSKKEWSLIIIGLDKCKGLSVEYERQMVESLCESKQFPTVESRYYIDFASSYVSIGDQYRVPHRDPIPIHVILEVTKKHMSDSIRKMGQRTKDIPPSSDELLFFLADKRLRMKQGEAFSGEKLLELIGMWKKEMEKEENVEKKGEDAEKVVVSHGRGYADLMDELEKLCIDICYICDGCKSDVTWEEFVSKDKMRRCVKPVLVSEKLKIRRHVHHLLLFVCSSRERSCLSHFLPYWLIQFEYHVSLFDKISTRFYGSGHSRMKTYVALCNKLSVLLQEIGKKEEGFKHDARHMNSILFSCFSFLVTCENVPAQSLSDAGELMSGLYYASGDKKACDEMRMIWMAEWHRMTMRYLEQHKKNTMASMPDIFDAVCSICESVEKNDSHSVNKFSSWDLNRALKHKEEVESAILTLENMMTDEVLKLFVPISKRDKLRIDTIKVSLSEGKTRRFVKLIMICMLCCLMGLK